MRRVLIRSVVRHASAFITASAAFLCLLVGQPHAFASGFATIGLTPDHYSPVTTAPVAAYSNPAALRAGPGGLRLMLDGTFAYRRATYVRTATDIPEPADGEGANTGEAELTNVFALPNLSAAMDLGDFTLGAGVFVPFGGAVDWSKNNDFLGDSNYVGAVDSAARWHSISGLWATGYGTLAGAYEIKKIRLSLGLSANYVYTQLELTQATTVILDDNLRNEGRMNTKLTGSTGSFGLGLHWEPIRKQLWGGISYQAPPGLWWGQTLEGPLRTEYGSGNGKDAIRLNQKFPDILQAGVRYRPDPRFEFRLTGNWQRFSVVKNQCLMRGKKPCPVSDSGLAKLNDKNGEPYKVQPFANFLRRWQDAFGARIAASAWVNDRWELFTALSWDGTAVPLGRLEPGLMDGNDIAVTLGTRLGLGDRVLLGLSYMHQVMVPRDTTGKSQLAEADYPNALPSAQGRYRQTVGVANLSLGLRFGEKR